jgi:hypothetical protein
MSKLTDPRCLKLYAPAYILALWAILWEVGVRGDRLMGALLALTAVSVVLAEHERFRIREEIRRAKQG